jgi:hypothetical protein
MSDTDSRLRLVRLSKLTFVVVRLDIGSQGHSPRFRQRFIEAGSEFDKRGGAQFIAAIMHC